MIRIGDFKVTKEQKRVINEILDSGRITEGEYVKKVERFMEKYLGVRNAIAVTNGTAGLQLVSQYIGTNPKKMVCVPAMTFPATLNAFVVTKQAWILCDIGEDLLIDITKLSEPEKRIINVIVPVHLLGYACNMDLIMSEAKKYGWIVIEDACEAFGTEYKGKKVGTFGNFGVYSFYVSHNVSGGEFGLVVTNDDEAAEVLRCMKNHGRTGERLVFNHKYVGSNYKTTELCAGLLYCELQHLEEKLKQRLENAKYFHDNIKNEELTPFPIIEGFSPLGYPIRCSNKRYRDYICNKLNNREIETRNIFPNLGNQEAYKGRTYPEFMKTTNKLEKLVFYIGVHTLLSNEDKEKMVDALSENESGMCR